MKDNDPSGYPLDNSAFREATNRVLQKRQADLEQAERFLRQLEEALRKSTKVNT